MTLTVLNVQTANQRANSHKSDTMYTATSSPDISLCDNVSLAEKTDLLPSNAKIGIKNSRIEFATTEKAIPLRIKDDNGNVFKPNTEIPFSVENEHCAGKAILKLKTEQPSKYEPYFAGKKRQFEIQIQGKFKNVGENDRVYIGIETDSEVKLNFLTRTFSKVILKLIHATTANVNATLGDRESAAQMTMPLHSTVDKLAVTRPNEQTPEMGVAEFQDDVSIAKCDRPKCFTYNTEDTYSFSQHGMYVNLVSWKLVNLPGLPDISLNKFLGESKLYYVCYILPENHTGKHLSKDKNYLFRFELENDNSLACKK
ncbi:hypothetical protein SARC_12761 [Sphaeroforma arctica JP610]|uniref:Domain of unknown function at the cortex 1 domain-containing protein n=1 Tax=Sphaeroforma arctica JP610 TaxID=667725 RepID=A0A0L0FF74_9EUKA|nr:hypothetical protein SARC_12761 [Sphaeroforma arctica JP610]KNC74698.1 hypothetical protein SARC_12761 [Sphaeroforma arctica JP610]|eukprot:XP_014148600.1 hypothetical protein SARC_12761 [Sphaeroforma arctica JP610]